MLKTILKSDRIWKPVDTNTVVNLDLQTDHNKTLATSETSSANMKLAKNNLQNTSQHYAW